MVDNMTVDSVEIKCLVPGLHSTCWVRSSCLRDGWVGNHMSVAIKGYPPIMSYWASWQEMFGYVDDPELNLDHLCRTSACWNPWHLDLVTHQVNVSRIGEYHLIPPFRVIGDRFVCGSPITPVPVVHSANR
jgi:hypothetical protein